MQALLQSIQQKFMKKKVPEIRPGYTVRIHQKIKEGEKERVQVFEGLVISLNSGSNMNKSFTVRKVVDGIGVERVFPLHSNTIEKIEVKKASKVRRSKLYYMRNLSGKAARLTDTDLNLKQQEIEESAADLAEKRAQEEAEENASETTTESVAQQDENTGDVSTEEASADQEVNSLQESDKVEVVKTDAETDENTAPEGEEK